jgi:PAS domain S-box-containing protein
VGDRVRAAVAAAAALGGADSHDALERVLTEACRAALPFDRLAVQPYGAEDRQNASERTDGPRITGDRSTTSILVPIVAGGVALGVLTLERDAADPYTDDDLEVAGVLAVLAAGPLAALRQAAERQAVDKAGRRSETRFRAVFEQLPLSMQVFDTEGWTQGVNRAWEGLFGLTPEQVRAFNPLRDPQLADVRGLLERGFAGDTVTIPPHPFDPGAFGDDAAPSRWLEVTVCPVRDAEQTVHEVIVAHRDVTAQVEAEASLRDSEESYRTLFELAADALFVLDVETGAILDANRKACELHGRTLDELRTLGVDGISGGGFDGARARAHLRRAVAGEPQRFEWVVQGADGAGVWVEVDLRRVHILGADRVLASVRTIEARKKAEAALEQAYADLEGRVLERTAELAQAEARFRAIVEASPTPLLLSRVEDGTVLYANERLEALVGAAPGSLAGQQTPDFYFDPADRPEVMMAVREHGYIRDFELRLRRLDGTPIWVSLTVQQLLFNGEPAIASALLDVTERKATEAALQERTQELEAIFRALPDLYFRMAADGTILDYRAGREFGLYVPPDAFLGRPMQDVLPPHVGEKVTAALAEVGQTGEPVYFEYVLPLGNDPYEFEARLLPLDGGQVISVVRDVTERKRAEEALRESEASYRDLFDHLTELVYIQSLDGRFFNVNEAVVQAYGYAREELIGQTPDMLAAPGLVDLDRAAETFAAAVAGEPQRFDWWGRRKDGTVFPKEVSIQRSVYFGQHVVIAVARDVTERAEAEAALRRSEEHFRRLTENASDMIQVVGPAGEIRYTGPSVQRLLGYTPEEIAGASTASFIHPDDQAGVAAEIGALTATPGVSRSTQYRVRHKDGRWRMFEARGRTLSPTSADEGFVVNARDVTERVEAEEALREREERFRSLIENAQDITCVIDPAAVMTYLSPSLSRVLGWEQDEVVGHSAFDFIHPDDVAHVVETLGRIVAEPGTTGVAEYRFRHKDGGWRLLEGFGRTLAATGPDEGVVVNIRDVTERREAEQALRFQKALLEAQGEASIDGVLAVSASGDVLSTNGRFVEMWGVPPDIVAVSRSEALLAAILERVPDPEAYAARVADLYAHPDETALDEVVLKDGCVFDRYTAPVRSRDGEHYGRIWFFRDVTAQRRHARELEAARNEAEGARERADRYARSLETSLTDLRQAQDRLVQQEKMASLGRLTAGIAHEIKNPLNFVTNFADLSVGLVADLQAELSADPARPVGEAIAASGDLLEDLAMNAQRIAEHGRRADSIVRGMMDHARGGKEPRRAVGVNALVEEALGSALQSWEVKAGTAAARATRDFAADAGDVEAGPMELGRVVVNLVSNALDALAERARDADAGYEPQVTVRTRRHPDRVEVVVEDNGVGVPEAARERLFEPFFTTKPTGHGNIGLGLSLSRDVVHGHGGTLEVESREGAGARFMLTLPAVRTAATSSPVAPD